MKAFPLLQLLLAGSFLLLPATASADNKNKRKVVPPTKKGAASELPTVKKVNGETVVIGEKTYRVTDSTEITVNGRMASVGDLKRGMQVAVAGGVLRYGRDKSDTIYKATRISATADNKLEAKRKDFNKEQAQKARKLNQQRNRRNRR